MLLSVHHPREKSIVNILMLISTSKSRWLSIKNLMRELKRLVLRNGEFECRIKSKVRNTTHEYFLSYFFTNKNCRETLLEYIKNWYKVNSIVFLNKTACYNNSLHISCFSSGIFAILGKNLEHEPEYSKLLKKFQN